MRVGRGSRNFPSATSSQGDRGSPTSLSDCSDSYNRPLSSSWLVLHVQRAAPGNSLSRPVYSASGLANVRHAIPLASSANPGPPPPAPCRCYLETLTA